MGVSRRVLVAKGEGGAQGREVMVESKWVGVRAGGVGAKVRGWVHEVGRQRWRQRWKQRWRAGKQE